jgi:hydrogenase-4 component E
MQIDIFLFGMLIANFLMVAAKRISALINGFCLQALLLFLATLILAIRSKNIELYIVAFLLFLLKVVLVPYFLRRIVKRIKVEENLGLFVNSALSLFLVLIFTYMAYLFASTFMPVGESVNGISCVISLSVMMTGVFMMISRIKALTQIIGLLVIENGLFVFAAAVSGGMPFIVEIAIFFDVFVCVIILGIFVYRINRLFTHIDVNKLRNLKG